MPRIYNQAQSLAGFLHFRYIEGESVTRFRPPDLHVYQVSVNYSVFFNAECIFANSLPEFSTA